MLFFFVTLTKFPSTIIKILMMFMSDNVSNNNQLIKYSILLYLIKFCCLFKKTTVAKIIIINFFVIKAKINLNINSDASISTFLLCFFYLSPFLSSIIYLKKWRYAYKFNN